MKFRPCIDLHAGRVKQIVGSTLSTDASVTENFATDRPAAEFAAQYGRDGLAGRGRCFSDARRDDTQ